MNVHVLPADLRSVETRIQRQHPRFKLPIRARLGDRILPVADWSVGGIGILDVDFDLAVGGEFEIELIVPLRECSVSVTMLGIARYHDRRKRRAGFQFRDVTHRQLAMLQFIIDEYLSGNVTEADGVLEFATKNPVSGRRAEPPRDSAQSRPARISDLASRVVGLGLASIIGLAAFALIFFKIYDRLFVFEAVSAQVSVQSIVIDAPVTGTVASLTTAGALASGDDLFSVVPAAGASREGTAVRANCACTVVDRPVATGSFVTAGSPVVVLAMRDATPFVTARIPFAALGRIYGGASIRLTYLDGTVVKEDASAIRFPSLVGRNGNFVDIEIPTGRAMPAEAAGQPVAVTFDTLKMPF